MPKEDKERVLLRQYEMWIGVDLLVSKIATFLFVETGSNTNTGNWNTSAEEIAESLNIDEQLVWDLKDQIVKELETTWEKMIAEVNVSVEDDGTQLWFDITLYHSSIPGFIQDDACLNKTKFED